jgi:hypothetical protein
MAIITLSVPTIKVNGETISIVPGSFNFTKGRGTTDVRAASTGGGGSESVHSVNAEEMYSKPKFDLYPSQESIALVDTWKSTTAGNTIQAIQDSIQYSFPGQSLMPDPEITASPDGTFTCEFGGDQMIGV